MEAAGRQRGQGERALALLPQTAGPREAEAHPRPHAPHLAAAVPQQPRVGQRLGARPAGRAGPAQPVRRQQHRLLLPQIAAGAPAAGPGKPCGLLSRPSAPRGRGPGLTATAGPHGGSSGAEQRGRCRDCGRPAPRARLPGLRVTSEDRADRRGDFAGWTLGGRGRTRLGGAKPVAAHTPADTTPQAAPSGGGRFAAQDPRLSPRSSSCQPSACPPQLAAPGTGLLQAPAVPHLRNTWGAERAPGLPVWGGD